jgi:hypothetical protein
MKIYGRISLLPVVFLVVSLTMLIGCGTSGGAGVSWGKGKDAGYEKPPVAKTKKGPPPWAPAHGHRAKHKYLYYPACPVYYDTGQRLYFYLETDSWIVSVSLPVHLEKRLGEHVVIEMDTDKPYMYYSEHKKKYPAGKVKNSKPKKWAHK